MSSLSKAQLDSYAQSAGFTGLGLATIVAIAEAESGGDPMAQNSANNSAGTDRGVLQINSFYHSEVSDACAYDPACAFKSGYTISQNGTSFTPWATYGNGSYKKFLDGSSTPILGTGTIATGIASSLLPSGLTDWLASPMRIVKMLFGLALVALALFMLIAPEATQKAIQTVKKYPELLFA